MYCLPCFIFSKKPNGRADSAHNFSVRCFINLKNSPAHIDTVINKQKEKNAANARLRLTTTIDAVRGHDETPQSLNRDNFLEMVKLLASYNKEVNEVVFENAPGNAKYTSHEVQLEILGIICRKVQISIREEIGNNKFCIMVDESRDESKKEQMAIVVRFVNKEGLIQERFLDLIHVTDTAALTLKDSICAVLADNNLSVQDIRGQGYDGASNMRGEWSGLKALILKECPYAYYIHCMAHQLQLALVAASREVSEVHNFFKHANFIINVVSASPKRNDELLANQAADIAHEIELGELDTGRGANQLGSLQRAGDTRWSSHYKSILSLKNMFAATVSVLRSVGHDRSGTKYSRGDAAGALKLIVSFDFVFVLFLMEKIMKTDVLCQTLQKKSLDILNAMDCVSNTKEVNKFCEKHEIDIPDLNQRYVDVTKSRNKHDNTTVLHHYKVDVFNVAIDQQLVELENHFSSQATELIALCSAYPMVNRLLRLVLTLPVSTATAERAFLAMRLVKPWLCTARRGLAVRKRHVAGPGATFAAPHSKALPSGERAAWRSPGVPVCGFDWGVLLAQGTSQRRKPQSPPWQRTALPLGRMGLTAAVTMTAGGEDRSGQGRSTGFQPWAKGRQRATKEARLAARLVVPTGWRQ
ncbi:hypothetical protein BS78_02G010000 [Paspalum vaginatum]|nr:hypothetical protein BS78_02G010000 [Paspalum vaginatum]